MVCAICTRWKQLMTRSNDYAMKTIFTLLLSVSIISGVAQDKSYEPSDEFPYGRPNPNVPAEFLDFSPMIGTCDCKSVQRNPDNTWADTLNAVWQFKYILNGWAIQDETWLENKTNSSSIRQFNPDSAAWFVTFYSSNFANPTPPTWKGAKENDDIVLNLPQKAPNGMDGSSRLTFYEISDKGFRWKGEWVSTDGQFVFPFWTLDCVKRE